MQKLTLSIVKFHAYMEAALNEKLLTRDDKDLSVKFAGWFFLGLLPAVWSGIFLLALLGDRFDPDVSKGVLAVVGLAILFGITTRTDRIYDANAVRIRELAWELRNDPNRGVWRVRLLVFGCFFLSLGMIIPLAKLILE